jgi:hypothetical protein
MIDDNDIVGFGANIEQSKVHETMIIYVSIVNKQKLTFPYIAALYCVIVRE